METNNDKYQNRYRIPSTRLQNWDYGWNAIYFVTICTKNRHHFFGEIAKGKMYLSPVGAIADVLWHELTNHFDNIELDAFVVMPNHIHGIIAINNIGNGDNGGNGINGDNGDNGDNGGNGGNGDNGDNGGNGINGGNGDNGDNGRDNACVVSTSSNSPSSNSPSSNPPSSNPPSSCTQQTIQPPKTIGQQRFQNQGSKTLSSIVGSYKSAVSRHAHRLGYDFSWQSRFYDIIVRDHSALIKIQSYIWNNPINWKEDKFLKQ
jgi:hypothetical protein